jgi:hypothetical protein
MKVITFKIPLAGNALTLQLLSQVCGSHCFSRTGVPFDQDQFCFKHFHPKISLISVMEKKRHNEHIILNPFWGRRIPEMFVFGESIQEFLKATLCGVERIGSRNLLHFTSADSL